MAKNIKAIKCPNCGSVRKTEIKPDYYRCSNCDTEYYLDNDDININVKHISQSTQFSDPATKKKNTTVIVVSIVVVLAVIIMNIITSSNKDNRTTVYTNENKKYGFSSTGCIVYQNTQTGKAVFMRLGREDIEDANNNIDYVNTHMVFIDPVSKKQLKDEMLLPHIRRLDDYFPSFSVFRDGTIYMLYPGARLFTVDRNANRLVEVTRSLFKNHPELSAGLATIQLDEEYMDLLTNDGNKYYFLPAKDLLTNVYDDLIKGLKSIEPDTSFQFHNDKLIKLTPNGLNKERKPTDLSPGRKYFDPHIILQDKKNLIITTGANASPDAPRLLQSIDVNKGSIIWTLPAKTFYYKSAARCREGFAVEYSSGQDQDYISGVLVISPAGKVLSDYLIKRGD